MKINFHKAFDAKSDIEVGEEKFKRATVLTLSSPTRHYADKKVQIERLIKELNIHLTPTLYLRKKKQKVEISFQDATGNPLGNINTADLPDFEETTFTIQEEETTDKQEIEFYLYHYIEQKQNESSLIAEYVADTKTVISFKEKEFFLSKRKNANIVLRVTTLGRERFLYTAQIEQPKVVS